MMKREQNGAGGSARVVELARRGAGGPAES